jgi:hypothetical protein
MVVEDVASFAALNLLAICERERFEAAVMAAVI